MGDNLFADFCKETVKLFIKLDIFFRLLVFGVGKTGKGRRPFRFFVRVRVKHFFYNYKSKYYKN